MSNWHSWHEKGTPTAKHLWDQRVFEKGPPLWVCVHCEEVSYEDIPDARGCPRKKPHDLPDD